MEIAVFLSRSAVPVQQQPALDVDKAVETKTIVASYALLIIIYMHSQCNEASRPSRRPEARIKRSLSILDAFPAHITAHRPRGTSYRPARFFCSTENTADLDLRGEI